MSLQGLLVGPVKLEPTTYGLMAAVLVVMPLFWLSMFGTRLIWFVRTLADCGRFRLS